MASCFGVCRGVQQRLVLAVLMSVILAALAISAALFLFTKERLYKETVRRSEEMVQAASLAFSQALTAGDEVLLDALLHELRSQKSLHVRGAYVINRSGIVLAHTRIEEHGKTYPVPQLLKSSGPDRLSEVLSRKGAGYEVLCLLQNAGNTIGGLLVSFSAEHVMQEVLSDMTSIAGTTVSILLLSGAGILFYARRTVTRLKRLREKALRIGEGDWDEPLVVSGSDEISDLMRAFNQMQSGLVQLRARDREAKETIGTLNRDLQEQLRTVEQLKEQLVEENAALRQELHTLAGTGEIIGEEGDLRELVAQALQLAPLPITVLITGASGTGKELLATFLHKNGARKEGPFVAINCAALPDTLVESELFGHEKGAFTGAISSKRGKFELADGGTLFLDEVGDLPHGAQAKLLRALQEREVHRLGGEKPNPVDVRVVAATNKDLRAQVASGNFREDLYYRLKVVELCCPPLRERLVDLPALAQHFVEHFGRTLGKPVVGIAPSALQLLACHDWPGNVRELENVIARAVALATTQVLGCDDFGQLSAEGRPDDPRPPSSEGKTTRFEDLVALCRKTNGGLDDARWSSVLSACEWICLDAALSGSRNQKEAAEMLGLTPTKLHRLIKKHGLNRVEGTHAGQKQISNLKSFQN